MANKKYFTFFTGICHIFHMTNKKYFTFFTWQLKSISHFFTWQIKSTSHFSQVSEGKYFSHFSHGQYLFHRDQQTAPSEATKKHGKDKIYSGSFSGALISQFLRQISLKTQSQDEIEFFTRALRGGKQQVPHFNLANNFWRLIDHRIFSQRMAEFWWNDDWMTGPAQKF